MLRKAKVARTASKERVAQRVFSVRTAHESEDARIRANAERAIARILREWEIRENGRLPKIPSAVEELVRFYCLDYERRKKALDEYEKSFARQEKSHAANAQERNGGRADVGESAPLSDKQSLHTSKSADENQKPHTHRMAKQTAEKSSHRVFGKRLHIVRTEAGKNTLTAPTAANYRRLNMLIDLALRLICDESVRDTMRHDIAERRGDRRTVLYYVDRRAYLSQKRKAKLAIAAALGLL